MNIKERIIKNIPVTYVDTNKFKSVCGILYFKSPITKRKLVSGHIIRNILLHTTKKYPTNRLLNINCLENYSASYSATLRRDGNYISNIFLFRSLDKRYTKEDTTQNVLDTFNEIIFNPNSSNNKFNDEEFDLAYQKIKSSIEAEKESAKLYASKILNKQQGDKTPISYTVEVEDLEKITNEEVYKDYLDMINNSEVGFIVAGHNVSSLNFDKLLSNIKTKKYNDKLKIETKIKEEFCEKIEEYNGLQSVLAVGLKLKDLTDYESTYVMPIFNNILGAGASSRLFDVIREKNSLCYSCFSRYEKDDNLIQIFAGIEYQNYEKTLNLTKEVIKSMEKIEEDEVKRAITDITSSLKECLDDIQNYVIPLYSSKLYNEDNILDKIENIKKVTKEDVEAIYNKLFITDSFFLKGGKTDE